MSTTPRQPMPPRTVLVTGAARRLGRETALALAAAGMLWFSLLEPSSSYTTHLMPAMFLTALGLGAGFLPMTLGAVAGVAHARVVEQEHQVGRVPVQVSVFSRSGIATR